MALTPQQMQALFQGISSGDQGGFAGATPGMGQDERNQWINQYGPGGGDRASRDAYNSWYQQNQATLNRQGPMYQPGGMFFQGGTGSNPTNPGAGGGIGAPPGAGGANPGGGIQAPPTDGIWDVNRNYMANPSTSTPPPTPLSPLTMPGASTATTTGAGGMGHSNAYVNPYYSNYRNASGGYAPIDPNTGKPPVADTRAPDFSTHGPVVTSVGGAAYNPTGAAPTPTGGGPAPSPTSTLPTPGAGAPGGGMRPKSFNFVSPGWGGGKAWGPGQRWG